MIYEQQPPFAVQLEPVEGCSLACSFCALQTLRDNGADAATGTHGKNSAPYRFMDPNIAGHVAAQMGKLGWNPRIEFAMHGEPTMHPKLGLIIGAVRQYMPKAYIMLTTNGSGLLSPGRIDELFKAGLDTLAWDMYKHATWNDRVSTILHGYAEDACVPIYLYPLNKDGNPHRRWKGQRIICISDISTNREGTHKLTNQGGNSGPAEPVEQRCAKPFRELSIRWDGNVALCCDDWKGEYKIDNVMKTPLLDIWHHPRFDAARRFLYRAERDAIKVCSGCNVRTYRNGLLPDKHGKDRMPAITSETRDLVQQAQRNRVFSIKLKRGD